MTNEERAVVLAALLQPLREIAGEISRDVAAAEVPLRRLGVDVEILCGALAEKAVGRPQAALAAAHRDIERATPFRATEQWRPAPNPFCPVELGVSGAINLDCQVREFTPRALVEPIGPMADLPELGGRLACGLTQVWREARDFDSAVWSILALQQRYLWFAPWSAMLDLPLPQAARIFAADALCRLRGEEQEPMQLVMGDLSGIQRYILAVRSAQDWGGAARRLRARSLRLQLLADVAGHQVLHGCDLPPTNLLLSSGGRFVILAPRGSSSERVLDGLQREWDRWLRRELETEVQLHLATCTIAGNEIAHAGQVFARASTELAERKLQAMSSVMQDTAGWVVEAFVGDAPGDLCAKCGRGVGKAGRCRHCERDLQVGAILPTTERLAYRRDQDGLVPVLGYSVDLLTSTRAATDGAYLVAATSFSSAEHSPLTPVRPLATHIPDQNGEPVRFEELAIAAPHGRPYLGYLKMDVDRLGAVLAWGLRRDSDGFDALPRLVALGDWIEWYFGGRVAELTRQPEWRRMYLIFAGGDDLLTVGPWREALDFAQEVARGFDQLSGGNPSVTLSAGLALGKARYPVAQMVGHAAEQLDVAKGNSPSVLQIAGEGRNSLGLFGDRLSWQDWRSAAIDLKLLIDPDTPSALLHVLLQCATLWNDFKMGDLSAARFVPLLDYTASRTIKPNQKELRAFVGSLTSLPIGAAAAVKLDHLGTIVRLALVARSSKEEVTA